MTTNGGMRDMRSVMTGTYASATTVNLAMRRMPDRQQSLFWLICDLLYIEWRLDLEPGEVCCGTGESILVAFSDHTCASGDGVLPERELSPRLRYNRHRHVIMCDPEIIVLERLGILQTERVLNEIGRHVDDRLNTESLFDRRHPPHQERDSMRLEHSARACCAYNPPGQ